MGRRPRFNLPGVPQHVITSLAGPSARGRAYPMNVVSVLGACASMYVARGNNREPCFYDKEDYVAYLEFLHIASEKTDCHVHAYVLMTIHVHMLITPMQEHGIRTSATSEGHYKVMEPLIKKIKGYQNVSNTDCR